MNTKKLTRDITEKLSPFISNLITEEVITGIKDEVRADVLNEITVIWDEETRRKENDTADKIAVAFLERLEHL